MRHRAITETNDVLLLIEHLCMTFSCQTKMKYFLFAKMHLKFPFANLWLFSQPQGVNTNNSDICLYQPPLVSWKGSNNFNRRWANSLYVYLTNYTHCSWWLLWQLDYHTIVPVPVKPPWIIYANETHGDDWKKKEKDPIDVFKRILLYESCASQQKAIHVQW